MRNTGGQAMFIVLFLAMLAAFSVSDAAAETMYAKKAKVKVTEQKSPTSKVVATLNRGDSVQVIQKSGKHYKVRTRSGKTGWVFKFRLSAKKVEAAGGSGKSLGVLTGETSVAAREARSGGSIRGLKETSKGYAKSKNIDPAHEQEVEDMERFDVPEDELIRFQQEGGVGEFAGGGL